MKNNPMIDAIPAWYEIDLEKDRNDTLVIRIYDGALEELRRIKPDAPILLHYQETMELPEFVGPGSEYWGFGEVFREIPCEQSGWVAYRATLPVVKPVARGDRLKYVDWNPLSRLRATLDVLFNALWLFDGDTGSRLSQLIIINNMAVNAGGAISATLTPAMILFLAKQDEGQDFKSVVNTMRRTDEYLWQEEGSPNRYSASQFHAILQKSKFLHLCVPGDGCGLNPDSHSYSGNSLAKGYKLVPHNVDNGIKQLSLLMGLAKLHSLARQSGM